MLPRYEDVDRTFPDCGMTCLPGRIAGLSHPINTNAVIHTVDREYMHPDVVTVCSSGVSCVKEGSVWALKPDSGAFWKKIEGRELRIIGVSRPWWESVLGELRDDGFHPAPGYALIEREEERMGFLESAKKHLPYGKCLESVGDGFSDPLKGERVALNLEMWRLDLEERDFYLVSDSQALIWADIASKNWLYSL